MSFVTIKKATKTDVATISICDCETLEAWAYKDAVLIDIAGTLIKMTPKQFDKMVKFLKKQMKADSK